MFPSFTFTVECKVNKHNIAVWIIRYEQYILLFEDGNWDGSGKTFRGKIKNLGFRKKDNGWETEES